MSIRSGRLTHTIEIRRTVPDRGRPLAIGDRMGADVVDEFGVPQLKSSSTSARIQAEVIEPRMTFEQLESGIKNQQQVTFRVRYITGLLPDDLIIYNEREFTIVQILEIGRRRGLEILTKGGDLARPKTVVTRNLDISDDE
jgi:hypothetical protein